MVNWPDPAWHRGHRPGGCSPRAASPHTPHTHSVVGITSTSLRLTIPVSPAPDSTGTRRIRRSTSRWRTSSTSVSSVTLITEDVITSRATSPARASRSCSLTRPTTPPVASSTGTALIRFSRSTAAISPTGVSADTVITGVVIISDTLTAILLLLRHRLRLDGPPRRSQLPRLSLLSARPQRCRHQTFRPGLPVQSYQARTRPAAQPFASPSPRYPTARNLQACQATLDTWA